MTIFHRAAALAALSLGIVGLAAVSAPGIAGQAASDANAVAAAPIPQLLNLVTPAAPVPTVAAVATTAPASQDQADTPTTIDTTDTDQAEFQSLAAAVAGQEAPGDLSNELRCLAGAVYYEAKGEPLAGQLAVAEVIINRAKSGRFPTSLCGVVTQAGQFSFVRGGSVPSVNPALAQWKTALAVAQVALDREWQSPASKALFFHARYVRPGWSKARVASIGNHVFYR